MNSIAPGRFVERHFRAEDYTTEQFWQLCAWCHAQGADEFTLALIGTSGPRASSWNTLEAPIKPFVRSSARREHLTAVRKAEFVREVELWTLSPASLAALLRLFPDGPFQYDISSVAWAEDLTLYREADLMLGVISHEHWGVLRLSELEVVQLAAAGFPTRTA